MNKNEFLRTLEKCLRPLPKEEVESALEYYKEYIDEMPEESREEQIAKLGNPKHIASRLIAEFSTEETFQTKEASKYKMATTNNDGNKTEQRNSKKSVSVWTLVFAVLSAPITIPFAIALIAILFALIIIFGAIVLVVYAVVLAIGVSGITFLAVSFFAFSQGIANGLFMLGSGLALVGLAILLGFGAVKLTQLLGKLFKKIISKTIVRRYNKNEKK